jgi:hypothetical protein
MNEVDLIARASSFWGEDRPETASTRRKPAVSPST